MEQSGEKTSNSGGASPFPSTRRRLGDTAILLRRQYGFHGLFSFEVLLHHMEMAHVQLPSAIILYAQKPVGGHVKMHSNRLSLIHSHISTQIVASTCAKPYKPLWSNLVPLIKAKPMGKLCKWHRTTRISWSWWLSSSSRGRMCPAACRLETHPPFVSVCAAISELGQQWLCCLVHNFWLSLHQVTL